MANSTPVPSTELTPQSLQAMAATFGLLASTMRLHIVLLLAEGEQDVGTLAEQVGGTLQAVSQHLAKLKLGGIVQSRREGRHRFYLIDDPYIVAIARQMANRVNSMPAGRVHGLTG